MLSETMMHPPRHGKLFEPDTIGQLICQLTRRFSEAPCLMSEEGSILTWTQLETQIKRTYGVLDDAGLSRSDCIAIVLPNGPTLAAAFLSVSSYAACAPLNPMYKKSEFLFYLNDLNTRALITTETAVAALDAAAELEIPVLELTCPESTPGLFALNKSRCRRTRNNPDVPTADSVALYLHTSGTTSRPKLVPLRHRNLVASARNIVAALELSNADRCLNLMPLFHIHGLVGGLLAPLSAGGSAVCATGLQPGRFFKWLETTRPSWYTAVPTMHQAILAEAEKQQEVIRRCPLRFVRSSSSPLSANLFDGLTKTFGAPVLEAYSMTEAAHQMTCNPLAPGKQKPGTVGLPAGLEVALMDGSGRILARGDTGEVVIRGATVMSGYEANPEANAAAFANGWFRTGDEGRFDSGGYLILTGRLKEQINRGGEKISPLEIDQVILTHPRISEAATFGFPHPTLGEELAAAVVPRTGCDIRPEDLIAFLREKLAPFKIPRRIIVLERLPKGPTGKVQRRQLSTTLGIRANDRAACIGTTENQAGAVDSELLDLWRRLLNSNSIGLDDDFFEKGGDSLSALQMLMEVEKITGHHVPESILVEHPTVRSFARQISVMPPATTTQLIHLQMQGTLPPFFLFHGDANGGFYARRLARLLGPNQPVIAIAPPGLESQSVLRTTEQIAADRLPLLLDAWPDGPFRVGGYCNGGMVALETAHLLIKAGYPVDLVVLIDSPVLNLNPTARFFFQSISKSLTLAHQDWEQAYPHLAYAADRIWRLLSDRKYYWRAGLSRVRGGILRLFSSSLPASMRATPRERQLPKDIAARERMMARAYNRMFRNYFPQTIAAPVVYFSAEYDSECINNLSPYVETIHIPGGHWGCITTHADVLAAHLRHRLEHLGGHRRSNRNCQESIEVNIKLA